MIREALTPLLLCVAQAVGHHAADVKLVVRHGVLLRCGVAGHPGRTRRTPGSVTGAYFIDRGCRSVVDRPHPSC